MDANAQKTSLRKKNKKRHIQTYIPEHNHDKDATPSFLVASLVQESAPAAKRSKKNTMTWKREKATGHSYHSTE